MYKDIVHPSLTEKTFPEGNFIKFIIEEFIVADFIETGKKKELYSDKMVYFIELPAPEKPYMLYFIDVPAPGKP